ncbi:MAG TPA: TIGR02206 family membrane protein [Terracidiphilus sp.]|jgi:hypothetical integral membrane protein (TIGR02206 family)|nr:TIGR02206 family membrane protein [Terracidiphilus sp.]
MKPYIHLFGPAHIFILCVVPAFAGVLALLERKFAAGSTRLRLGVATAMVLDSAMYYGYLFAHGSLSIPNHLPLELCDASLVLVIVSLFTLNRLAFDLAYYFALAGTSMALLTPNLWEPFPSFGTVQFFVAHGLIVAATLYLVWSGQARPRPGSVLRAMIGVNVFAAVVGTFDAMFKTNYMYLRSKPPNASLLDFLGPWPWYLMCAEGVAAVLFTLLYLPVRRPAVKAAQHDAMSMGNQARGNARRRGDKPHSGS